MISNSFYTNNFKDIKLQPLTEILHVECADGQILPYLGFIEADLTVKGIPKSENQPCLFLIVPDTAYSARIPVILGTNVLSELLNKCKGNLGERF